jgi:transglutaminase-like putative cysteine protease
MTAAALRAGTPGAERAARRSLAVRLGAVGALALFVALQWATLLFPTTPGRMILGVGVGAAAGATIAVARRRRRLVVASVCVALVPLVLLAAGATVHDLLPGGWSGFFSGMGDALGALPQLRVPYTGADDFVALVTNAGGIALIALAFVAAAALRRRGRAVAVVALVVVYAVPATETSASSPYLRGAVFAVLVGAVLWAERLARPGAGPEATVAAALLGLGAVAGLALGPGLDVSRPWVDWDKVVNDLSRSDTEQFAWDQTYGPMDWPRDGRVVLRVKAKQSAYWKAANLDGFDGTRWVRAGLRPDQGSSLSSAGADVALNPKWEENIRISLAGIRTDQVVGAGSTLSLHRLRLRPVPVGSPGTWAVVGQLHSGDTYDAHVYVPRPSPDQLAAAGTAYPDVTELYRSIRLPAAGGDPARGTEMVFRPFGSHRQPVALGPTATIAEQGNHVLARSPYGRVYALARRLADGAANPYEFTRRINDYLSSGRYSYSEDPPRSAVPLDAFLFHDYRGYCQQFSGAMALLLRMGGVPARVAAGFSPGSLNPSRGEYIVRDVDAHAWVEAYFPKYGWVTFDPTPAIAPARAQEPFDPVSTGGGGATADGGIGDTVADPKGGGKSVAAPDHASFPVLPVVAAVLAVVGLALLALALVRWLRHRKDPPADPQLAELERALRRSGRPATDGITLRRLERTFAGEPGAAAYVRAVREARYGYGSGPPTVQQRRALRRALAAGWEYTGRLRSLWALPPSVW